MSRNLFVIQACEQALADDSGQWHENLFEPNLSSEDQALLNEASVELEAVVLRNRVNRGESLR